METKTSFLDIDQKKYDFNDEIEYLEVLPKGLSLDVVKKISQIKKEPEWMLNIRIKAYEEFLKKPMQNWGPDLSHIDFNNITYYMSSSSKVAKEWEDVPENIKKTFERLGIPESEKKFLAGAGAQYECLSKDSLVFTNPKGPVKISEIKEGDHVFSFDENENVIKRAKVLGVMAKGQNEVYEITIDNKKIKATANHPFLVLTNNKKEGKIRGRFKREWKSLKDLKKGDLVTIIKKLPYEGKIHELYQPVMKHIVKGRNQFGNEYDMDISGSYNEVSIPKTTSKDLMWFFGVYVGDGYIKREVGKDKKRVYFAVPAEQNELRNELRKVVKNVFDCDAITENKDVIIVNSTLISDFIEINGFKGNAKQKRVPKWVIGLTEEQRLSFLGGYVDSDGYPTHEKKANILVFRSANKELINDFRDLVIYCNFHPTKIHFVQSKHPYDKERIMDSYQIEISGNLNIIDSRYPPKASRLKTRNKIRQFNTTGETNFRKHANDYIGFAKIKSIDYVGVE